MSLVDLLPVLETVAVSAAVASAALIASTDLKRRQWGFIAALTSSSAALPMFLHNELYSYSALQVFYLATALVGLYNVVTERIRRKEAERVAAPEEEVAVEEPTPTPEPTQN